MENASKALLIAGGVFVAIIILVIAVQLFIGYRDVVNNYHYTTTVSEITEINRKFTKYEGKEVITIHDVVSAIKTAKNYNDKYNSKIIDVKINNISKIDLDNNRLTDLIKDNQDVRYKVGIDYHMEDCPYKGMVSVINFSKIS